MAKLEALFKQMNKDAGYNLVSKGELEVHVDRIPFSSMRANYMLYGGIPRGRLVEFFGGEGGGKTTTSMDIVANAQVLFRKEWESEIDKLESIERKLTKDESARLEYLKDRGPLKVVYADNENTFDYAWASLLGIDIDSLWLMRPENESAEDVLSNCLIIIETGEVGLLVIDSIAAMLSKQAMEKDVGDKTYCGISNALTTFSNKAAPLCKKTNCTIIGINQVRDNINSAGYGGPLTTTPGGRAWKHACSVRIEFKKGQRFDEKGGNLPSTAESPFGHYVMMAVKKSKICKNNRMTGQYKLVYDTGIDTMSDLIDILIKHDIIVKSGAWFAFKDLVNGDGNSTLTDEDGKEVKVQGMAKIGDFLLSHEELYNKYLDVIEAYIAG